MQLRGKAWKYGANVDTDVIIPARYLTTSDPKVLAPHCMEDLDPEFATKISPGDMIVAETNFGCGSSREHAPVAIKGAGISCVIAKSFARIFYRNAINTGLPILECPGAVDGIGEGNVLSVELETGRITNLTTGEKFTAVPFPPFVREIIAAGGLMKYVKGRMGWGVKFGG